MKNTVKFSNSVNVKVFKISEEELTNKKLAILKVQRMAKANLYSREFEKKYCHDMWDVYHTGVPKPLIKKSRFNTLVIEDPLCTLYPASEYAVNEYYYEPLIRTTGKPELELKLEPDVSIDIYNSPPPPSPPIDRYDEPDMDVEDDIGLARVYETTNTINNYPPNASNNYPPNPETLTRKEIVEYILNEGESYYLENNHLCKSVKYIMKNFKIKELYYHYNNIREVNDIYS